MKIGISQINTKVGDILSNLDKAKQAYCTLSSQNAELVLFALETLSGYFPKDLVSYSCFLEDNLEALNEFAAATKQVPSLIGFIENSQSGVFNSLAFCQNAQVKKIIRLSKIGSSCKDDSFNTVIEQGDLKIGLSLVSNTGDFLSQETLDYFSQKNINLLVCFSQKPWSLGETSKRDLFLEKNAQSLGFKILFVNGVGFFDSQILSGESSLYSNNGKILSRLGFLEEQNFVVDTQIDSSKEQISHSPEIERLYKAICFSIKDYCAKSGFKKAVIGLSGGIDCSVVASLATAALGKENVIGVSMPSEYSSSHSKSDAKELAQNLGIEFKTIAIKDIVSSSMGLLAEHFEGLQVDYTEENLQSRARAVVLMALSNKYKALLLNTGNKSEAAVGYCTLYGDSCGGLSVIGDIFKDTVYEMARFINKDGIKIPLSSIEKAPSAELRPDQKDSDTLPPYDILDAILKLHIVERKGFKEICSLGFDSEVVQDVLRRVRINEYKRAQCPLCIKVSDSTLGIDRKMSLTNSYTA